MTITATLTVISTLRIERTKNLSMRNELSDTHWSLKDGGIDDA